MTSCPASNQSKSQTTWMNTGPRSPQGLFHRLPLHSHLRTSPPSVLSGRGTVSFSVSVSNMASPVLKAALCISLETVRNGSSFKTKNRHCTHNDTADANKEKIVFCAGIQNCVWNTTKYYSCGLRLQLLCKHSQAKHYLSYIDYGEKVSKNVILGLFLPQRKG